MLINDKLEGLSIYNSASSQPENYEKLVFRLNLEAFLGLPLFNSQDLFGTAVSNNEFFCVSQDDPVSWDPLTTVITGRESQCFTPPIVSWQS